MRYLVLVIFLMGCGRGSGTEPAIGTGALAGDWVADCQDFGGLVLEVELAIGGSTYVQTISRFEDTGCAQKLYDVQTSHTIAVPQVSEAYADTFEVNLAVIETTATAMATETANSFSAQSVCDIATWNVGTSVDITDAEAGCFEGDLPVAVGTKTFTIMRPIDGELSIGQNSSINTGESEATRHIEFAPAIYRRQ